MSAATGTTRWLTYRKVLTPVVLALASSLLWFGKLTSGDWMVTALGCLAGHHAPDLIAAWRGRNT